MGRMACTEPQCPRRVKFTFFSNVLVYHEDGHSKLMRKLGVYALKLNSSYFAHGHM